MIKAIFLDIDGTLVSMKTHKIPQSAIDAIAQAKSKGVKIFIATGRPTSLINNIPELQERDLIDGYVTMNGAYCIVDGEVVHKNPLSIDQVKTIIEFSIEQNISCPVILEHSSGVFQPTPLFEEIFYKKINVAPMTEFTVSEVFAKEIFQLSPFIDQKLEVLLSQRLSCIEINRWDNNFVDMGSKGSTKSHGIDVMCKHFGLEVSETMAIGDGGNDISMLEYAGLGVAMGNAAAHVQASANYVTAHIDDGGLAAAIDKFVL